MSVFVGDSGAVEQGMSREYDPNQGFSSIRRFKGPQTAIELKEQELQSEGYTTRITEGPVWELEARIAQDVRSGGGPTSETPVDTWELFANQSEKDILLSTSAAVSGLVNADLLWLRELLEGKLEISQYQTETPAFTSPGSGNPAALFAHIMAGMKSVLLYQPILRHTRTVSRAYEIPYSLAGVGQVYSSARLASDNSVPSSVANQLQASSYSDRTVGGYTMRLYLGWLKTYPQITVAAYGKSQIVSEWQWGEWSTLFYTVNA